MNLRGMKRDVEHLAIMLIGALAQQVGDHRRSGHHGGDAPDSRGALFKKISCKANVKEVLLKVEYAWKVTYSLVSKCLFTRSPS